MYININKIANTTTNPYTMEKSNIVRKNGTLNLANMGSVVKDSIGLNNGPHLGIKQTNAAETAKDRKKHMLTPEAIAQKIATGKEVSQEEIDYLKETDYQLYLQAMQAARYRETLEQKLKSTLSDTAKMQTVSESMNMAMSFQATAESSPANELIAAAIMEAIKDEGQNIQTETKEMLEQQKNNNSFSIQPDSDDISEDEKIYKSFDEKM